MQKIAVSLTVILLLIQNAHIAASMPPFFSDRAIKLHDKRLRELEDNQRRKMLLPRPQSSQSQYTPALKETGSCVPIKTISVERATLLSSHQVRASTQAHER